MYRPHLLHTANAELIDAQDRASEPLFVAMRQLAARDSSIEPVSAAVAAWSVVHGFATLWLNGDLPPSAGTDPEAAVRVAAGYLFRAGAQSGRRSTRLADQTAAPLFDTLSPHDYHSRPA